MPTRLKKSLTTRYYSNSRQIIYDLGIEDCVLIHYCQYLVSR